MTGSLVLSPDELMWLNTVCYILILSFEKFLDLDYDPDCHRNLITWSFQNVSSESVQNFLTNLGDKQTLKKTSAEVSK